MGEKGQKLFTLTLLKTPTKTENLHRWMDIFYEKFDVVPYLLHITIFDRFWGNLGVKKFQKLPILLKNITQKCSIFVLVVLVLRGIRSCHSFLTKYNIWPIWDPQVQWGLKTPPCTSMSLYKHSFQNKNYIWCQCIVPFNIICVLNIILTMQGYLFRTWIFLASDCKDYRLKELMIVRNWTTCYGALILSN